ncbi:MAG: FHA domain-containing protein [Planctomycetota bacterium]
MPTSLTLRIEEPGRDARVLEAPDGPFTLGRQLTTDVVIHDRKVSREHVRVEIARGRILCTDLDSANGFKRGGERVREARLDHGDEIHVGETTIRFLAPDLTPPKEAPRRSRSTVSGGAPTQPRAAAEPVRLSGTTQRTVANRLIPALVIIGGIAAAVIWATRPPEETGGPSSQTQARTTLEAFGKELNANPVVNASTWKRGRTLIRDHEHVVFPVDDDPAAEIAADLERLRRAYFQTESQRFQLRHAELFEARRYGDILAALSEFERSTGLVQRSEREWFSELTRNFQARLDSRATEFRRSLAALLERDEPEELRAFLLAAREEFSGTDVLAEIDRHLDPQDVATTAAPVERINAEPEAVDEVPPTLPELLTPLLATGALDGKRFTFEGYRGQVHAADAGRLTVKSSRGESTLALTEVPPIAQLEMALHLRGDPLLDAARAGYALGLDERADRLVLQYAKTEKENPAAQTQIDAFLAAVRGFGGVPAGGFVHAKDHGWETATERSERETLAAFDASLKNVTAKARQEAFDRSVTAAIAAVEDPEHSEPLRSRMRDALTTRLTECRSEAIAELEGAGAKPFDIMREARLELDRRRRAAIEMIMDAEIYLPEDHPDWPKGDHKNGQKEVDVVVDAVREAWGTTRYDFALSAKFSRQIDRLNAVEEHAARLGHSFGEGAEPALVAELRRNPGPRVTLTTYALNDEEVTKRAFNDRVRAYHATFTHEDVAATDVQHIAFVSDYREMLGLRRCFVDARLCRATRKHSEVCDKAGTIWHVGPNGSPQSRARAEGFTAPVGENVAIGYGNPRDIWSRGWYRASDHHRNAISAGWNCMGYGYAGRVGTQNFAEINPPWETQ